MKLQNYGELEEILLAETNCRWKMRVIYSKVKDASIDKTKVEDAFEIICITAIRKAIRLHGIGTLSAEPVYVEKNHNFETIPCCCSKVDDGFDLMFENSIEIAKYTTIKLKVPVSSSCSSRFVLNNCDLFLVEAIRNGNAEGHLAIEQIFISSR